MRMILHHVAVLLAASIICCSAAVADNQFVTVDTVQSIGDRIVVTSLSPITVTDDQYAESIVFQGDHLSYNDGKHVIQNLYVTLNLPDADSVLSKNKTNENYINDLLQDDFFQKMKIHTERDQNIGTKNIYLMGSYSARTGAKNIRKTILNLSLNDSGRYASVIITDDPVPILWPAIVGIAAVLVIHSSNCAAGHSEIEINLKKLSIKSVCSTVQQ